MDQDLKQYLDEKFEAIDEKFEGVRQEFEGVRQEFEGVRQEFDGVRQEFDGVRQEFAGVRQEFAGVRQEFAAVRSEMDARFALVDRKIDESAVEVRRHFDVTAEYFKSQVDLALEAVINVQESLDRNVAELRAEMRALNRG